MCTGNSCRSQMAEGWAKELKAGRIEAFSAGTAPQPVDPLAVRVMAEAGVDISGASAKSVDDLPGQDFDYVITLCDQANETCPFFPGPVKRFHKGFEDPPLLARAARSEEEVLAHYRRIRDEIKAFVESLPESLAEDDPTFTKQDETR